MHPVKVSVIIPTFNRNSFLESAIESVLTQTFRDFEIIIVDDASSDDVHECLKQFDDPRLKHIRHKVNRGEAGARNTGIENSTGEYIAFLDDDDTWLPEKIEQQLSVLENLPAKVAGIYSGYVAIEFSSKKTLYTKVPAMRGDICNDLLVRNLIGTPSTVMIRRACIQQAGLFDENLCYGVDHDFYLRIAKHYHFEYIKKPLVKYTIHEKRLTNNPDIVAKGLEAFSRKYSEKICTMNFRRSKHLGLGYLSVGVSYCFRGDTQKGIEALKKSIRIYPFEPRAYLNLIFSWTGVRNFTRIKQFKDIIMAPLRTNRIRRY